MIIMIDKMTHRACIPALKFIAQEISMAFISVEKGYIVIEKNTDPSKIEQLRTKLEEAGMSMDYGVCDPLVEKITREICNIFTLSEADTLILTLEHGRKFSIEAYLTSVLNYDYGSIRRAFKDQTGISPKQYYMDRRWEHILHWFSLGKSVTEVAELALFRNRDSLSNYFKEMTGVYPTEYKFQEEPKFECEKICKFHSFCSNFHSCPNCGHSNFMPSK